MSRSTGEADSIRMMSASVSAFFGIRFSISILNASDAGTPVEILVKPLFVSDSAEGSPLGAVMVIVEWFKTCKVTLFHIHRVNLI